MANPNSIASIVQQHIKPILQAYDKDSNASLDKDELRKLLADNLGVAPNEITQDQLDWHFSKIDENGDGKITFDEYFNHFFLKRAKDARKDQNENELIDINEFRKLMEDTFKPLKVTITQEMVEWNFNQIDTDHSGRISFDEFLKFIKKYNS